MDRYRSAKVREREQQLVPRPLSNTSINKTITRLAQILEVAVEYGHLDRNPASGRRRRLKASPRRAAWLEPDQVQVLIDSAGRNRALVATAVMAGLRAGELCELRWADIDLARSVLTVRQSKTDSGRRVVDLSPDLRDELAVLKARVSAEPNGYVFTTRNGTPQTRYNIRRRILLPAVKRANEQLVAVDQPEINQRLTTHSLRHTFASLLFEAGATVPYVMASLGHSDPKVTLGIYSHILKRKGDTGARVDALIRSSEAVPMGTSAQSTPTPSGLATEADSLESAWLGGR